jgi:hypothetical protein
LGHLRGPELIPRQRGFRPGLHNYANRVGHGIYRERV